ncbi:cytochrome b/b6 domain-containing protein [Mucilaginibacter sp. KACC 22063]|uniref:cytochrome b/b6 domain-containing protein n=1 Tax=Mucilaginibacter sp. KACC 22063 TaxID=3025666 RepID=UPI0023661A30|nr:cytochrome b/b6 domain-containing protein [Mucilaginibacter sp. KACC 22063]WDF54687.1 cytochrome b/b6 domain-containing protein [Mucilaginibacter sp. KACC 22063]
MAIIEPVKQNPLEPSEVKKYPRGIRLWHWLNALVISGSLITVLLNSTLLDRSNTSKVITSEAAKNGAVVSAQLSKGIAHELGDQVWNVHGYIGLILAALLIYRIIYELVQPVSQSLFKKISLARIGLKAGGEERQLARHELVVKLMYVGFYIVLIVMAITGCLLFFEDQLGLPKPVAHQIKEVHGALMYAVIAFIVVHIVGVILAERDRNPGIVSDMINGGYRDHV